MTKRANLSLLTLRQAEMYEPGETIRFRVDLVDGATHAPDWQLRKLRESGAVDFVETRAREVTLYWRALPKGVTKEVDLDLLATATGAFTGPASSACVYYDDAKKAWAAPLKLEVR